MQAGIITDSTKERLNELEERRKMLEEQIEEEKLQMSATDKRAIDLLV
ncbi:MAG: hypothetical protein L6V84_08360 [Oscillospiraceae bacterium]|nr:MAG: hypothetical protein L6V84_08360 [Oscillospiraceae bacterium]